MTLTEFMLGRVAEDERWLQAPIPVGVTQWMSGPMSHASLLAGCKARRAIVENDERNRTDLMRETDTYSWTTRVLAAVYAGHPDYREEWRP